MIPTISSMPSDSRVLPFIFTKSRFASSRFRRLTCFSSIMGGLLRWALSPMRVPVRTLALRGSTSPVASSRGRRSMRDRSAWSTRLEFYQQNRNICSLKKTCENSGMYY
ncbi:hypothetical protein NP493_434g00010 [Ridgeia piscesae]|uniref:Uncharacterized protein n=1 Tax=Ridgeia piscesae TaxID=27915 RepID=A0AAD9L0D4_RIDPI|nr:hypothetical protein NP493_434g00010 [Ridgeia piscesae]